MNTPYKLHVKIGHAEFEAEGSEKSVKEQFDQFLAAIGQKTHTDINSNGQQAAQSADNGSRNTEVDATILAKAFRELDDQLSLLHLPPTETQQADALLLILYGYHRLKDQAAVGVMQLMGCARQSGLQIERADRTIASHMQFVNRGGYKRGSRYGLNNRGIAHCEEILREMFS